MAVRRKTENRWTLYRNCYVCGKSITTTAATPFVRQIPNVNGKKQYTAYFCSETCKNKSYKHLFDLRAWERKEEYERNRDTKEKNRKYYQAHREQERARSAAKYHAMTEEDRQSENAWRRRRHAQNREEDNRKRREYRQRKKQNDEWGAYIRELNRLDRIGSPTARWA